MWKNVPCLCALPLGAKDRGQVADSVTVGEFAVSLPAPSLQQVTAKHACTLCMRLCMK